MGVVDGVSGRTSEQRRRWVGSRARVAFIVDVLGERTLNTVL